MKAKIFMRFTLALTLTLCLALPLHVHGQLVNRQHPLSYGLVAWWRVLPGLSGGAQWYDLAGRFPATLTNMAAAGGSGWGSTARPGGAGEVRFDGTNDYTTTATTAALFPLEATYTLWVKRSATGSGDQVLFEASPGVDRMLFFHTNGVLAYNITFTTGNFGGDFTGPSLPVGVWTHVTMQISGTRGFRLYLNCALAQGFTADGSTFAGVTKAFMLGAHEAGATFLLGALDDVRVYSRALTDAEVCTVMQESSTGDRRLLPPPTLLGLLGSVPVAGNPGSFLPFFSPQ